MTESAIPSFSPAAAHRLLDTLVLRGVRHRQAILDLALLRRMRRIARVPAADPELLAYQETLWPHLSPIMDVQRADGAWQPLDRDRVGWFDTTPWILVFLGYLGLDGTAHAGLQLANLDTLSYCPGQGHQWSEFGHFRHICPDWFEVLAALVESGFRDRTVLDPVLARIGAACVDGTTWLCGYKAHRSVLLDGKRRTVSWPMNLEPIGHPSPWLTIRALEISALLDAS